MNIAIPLRSSRRSRCMLLALGTYAALAAVGCSQERGDARSADASGRDAPEFLRTVHLLGSGSNASEIVYSQVYQLVAGTAASASCDSTGVFVVALDGTTARLERPWLTCGFVWELDVGALGPAGDILAYASKMDPVTLRLINLETGSISEVATRCRGLIEGIAWNLSGTLLAVVERCGSDAATRGSLEVAHVDGSRRAEALANGVHGNPSWAASDRAVAVASTHVENRSQVVLFDRRGRVLRTIDDARDPAIDPTSEVIAFSRMVEGDARVFRADLNSSTQLQPSSSGSITSCSRDGATTRAHSDLEMRWSRDGQVLAVKSGSCIWRAEASDSFGRWKLVTGR